MNLRRCCVILLALWAVAIAHEARAASKGPVKTLKGWLASHMAEPLAETGFQQAPLFTWIMGWDFQDRRWKLNEYTNQMVHMMIGGAINHIADRPVTFCVAVGIEAQQFFFQDHRQWKLPDRTRDVLFYFAL